MEERKVLKNGIELVKSVSDKHLDLLRPSSRLFSMFKGHTSNNNDREKGKYAIISDDDFSQGVYDEPLPCFGCGIGWFSRVWVSFNVVLCYIPLFGKLLSERSSGAWRSCCFCNCCNGVFSYLVYCSSNPTFLAD
ncbi:hypothetical protein R6Q57_022337 [Mikania cordata]